MDAPSLTQRYLSGEACAQEVEQLDALLKSDPQMRQEFRFQAELDAHLCEASREAPPASGPIKFPVRRKRRWLSAVAAIVIAAFSLHLFLARSDGTIVTVSDYGGSVVWTGSDHLPDEFQIGARLRSGTLESLGPASWATLQFEDGTTFTVTGSTALTVFVDEHKELRLKRGNLNADVTPQSSAHPLAIHTPVAEFAVLGTRLDLSANATRSQLTVREGRVRMTHCATGDSIEVSTAQRGIASLDGTGELRQLPIPAPTNAWMSKLPENISQGTWLPEFAGDRMGLRVVPRIDATGEGPPSILYHAAISVSGEVPVLLTQGSRLSIRGKNDSTHSQLTVGLTTTKATGGFAGQFTVVCQPERLTKGGGEFEIEIPIEAFSNPSSDSPDSPAELQLTEWWCSTASTDLGISIFEVRLIPAEQP